MAPWCPDPMVMKRRRLGCDASLVRLLDVNTGRKRKCFDEDAAEKDTFTWRKKARFVAAFCELQKLACQKGLVHLHSQQMDCEIMPEFFAPTLAAEIMIIMSVLSMFAGIGLMAMVCPYPIGAICLIAGGLVGLVLGAIAVALVVLLDEGAFTMLLAPCRYE
eukprot:TRINITY_DN18657_c0_g1_i1.p1 TRINITY_DN18657_c0_g1~~TRINITY_DN18657_c0_g1_i1.p1  ORF type:complete len:162 (-),score=16.19 TRINITY_DN18657_c0_g1_i1:326-811(-)